MVIVELRWFLVRVLREIQWLYPFLLVALVLAIVEEGSAGWREEVEGIEKRASLDIVDWEGRALVILLVLVTGGEEYLSLRAANETLNSEWDTSSKVNTWTNKGKVFIVESA